MLKKINKNQKGFTLVELIVVIAILAVLATLLIPRIMGNVQDARRQNQITDAQTIAGEISVRNAQAMANSHGGSLTTIPSTLPAAGAETAVTSGMLTGSMAVSNFPDNTVVQIMVDHNGNTRLSYTP